MYVYPLFCGRENLNLQEIAVLKPYSGEFASTPCSIFGLLLGMR